MPENHQSEQVRNSVVNPEDEIALMDYLLIIWKRRYLILIGTIICGLAAAVVNFSKPKESIKYRVDMTIEPGVKAIDSSGNKVYIDSVKKVKAIIDSGILNSAISNRLKMFHGADLSSPLTFDVSITPPNLNMVKISYRTTDIDSGKKTLNYLADALMKFNMEKRKWLQDEVENRIQLKKEDLAYSKVEVERIKINHENEILLKKSNLTDLKFNEKIILGNINDLNKGLERIETKAKYLNSYSNPLIRQEEILTKENDSQNFTLSTLLASNVTQQYLILENLYYQQINNFLFQKKYAILNLYSIQKQIEDVSKEIAEFEAGRDNVQIIPLRQPQLYAVQKQMKSITAEIKKLEKEKNNIQMIQILQPLTVTKLINKSKMSRNVILATVLGLFLSIFLAIFFNYLSSYKSRMKRKNAI